jgi:phage/plasmid-like protein (TIGR03299 family)
MAHNLFNEKFFSFRKPAWHNLGKVMDTEHTAAQAFDLVGAYDVHTEQIFTATGVALPNKAIMRTPTALEPAAKVFGIVGENYELVSPRDVVEQWDRAVSRPVETLGALDDGATMFVSTKLPTVDVMGDDVENYMLLVSPMTGNDALQIRVAPVRVVCQNTLIAAKAASTETYRIVHDQNAQQRLREWLVAVYDHSIDRMNAMQRSFVRMAETTVTSRDVDNLIELTYTMPKLPRRDCPQVIYDERMLTHELHSGRIEKRREAARELFEGKGLGSTSKAASGTVWGVYNAVVELEDFGGQGRAAAKAESALTGTRAEVKERAYTVCVDATRK